MVNDRQVQKAGDNSQQFQASNIIINQGITEERARVIMDEKLQSTVQYYTQEAHHIAEQRIKLFADDLIPKLVKENLLDELKDPSIQILLSESQRTAASSERPADYSLLSELLIHRIEKGRNRNVRAGISRAIEIVDKISDDALLGLTVAFALAQYRPVSGNIFQGLDVLCNLFEKLCYDSLPLDGEWLEHLDILDAVRINSFGTLKKFEEYYCERLSGYVGVGIRRDSDNYAIAIAMLQKLALPETLLINHDLNEGYVRIPVTNEDEIKNIQLIISLNKDIMPQRVLLTTEQKQTLHQIYALYENNESMSRDIKKKFCDEVIKRPSFNVVREWWNKIPVSFSITAVGRVLAHANAKRNDESLPDFD